MQFDPRIARARASWLPAHFPRLPYWSLNLPAELHTCFSRALSRRRAGPIGAAAQNHKSTTYKPRVEVKDGSTAVTSSQAAEERVDQAAGARTGRHRRAVASQPDSARPRVAAEGRMPPGGALPSRAGGHCGPRRARRPAGLDAAALGQFLAEPWPGRARSRRQARELARGCGRRRVVPLRGAYLPAPAGSEPAARGRHGIRVGPRMAGCGACGQGGSHRALAPRRTSPAEPSVIPLDKSWPRFAIAFHWRQL